MKETARRSSFGFIDGKKLRLGIRRRLWLILACGVVCSGLFAAVAFRSGQQHSAEAILVHIDQDVPGNRLGFSPSGFNMETLKEMITLPQSLASLQQSLGLELDPATLSKMIQVDSSRASKFIRVIATADNPNLAADMANALASLSVEESRSRYHKKAEDAFKYYREEQQEAQGRFSSYLDELREFKRGAQWVELDVQNETLAGREYDIQREFRQASIQYEEALIEYENLEREVEKQPDHVVSFELDENPLKARIAHKEIALLEVRSRYGEKNPKVKLLEEEVRELRHALSEETLDSATEQVYEKNYVKDQLKLELLRLQGKVRASLKKKQELRDALAESREEIEDIPEEQLQYAKLKRQAEEAESEIGTLMASKRLAENQMERGTSDLGIHEMAVVSPSKQPLLLRLFPTIGFLIGSFVGLVLVAVREVSDRKVVTAGQVRHGLGMQTILRIPFMRQMKPKTAKKWILESIRELHERIDHEMSTKSYQSIAFTSAQKGEGKSTLAYHLAEYYQRLGKKTVYVDFDYARNHFAEARGSAAINRYLNGNAKFDELVGEGAVDCLKVEYDSEMRELVKSKEMRALWKELCDRYEVVILDTPGIAEDGYAVNLAEMADVCFYVVGSSQSDRRFVEFSLDELGSHGVKPRGVILNKVISAYIDDPILRRRLKKQALNEKRS